MNARAGVCAGVAAGIAATLAQVFLWIAFTEAFPAVLVRDVRLTAAIVLGPGALDSASAADMQTWIIATLVHFSLSIAYGIVLAAATHKLGLAASLLAGALFGLAVYALNMHGFTRLFPWFEAARDPITIAAHLVFGVTAAFVYRRAADRGFRS
jgi:hypothetical protein